MHTKEFVISKRRQDEEAVGNADIEMPLQNYAKKIAVSENHVGFMKKYNYDLAVNRKGGMRTRALFDKGQVIPIGSIGWRK